MLKQWCFEGREAFYSHSFVDRFFIMWWLVGPFFLLTERSPADLWISFLGLSFLVRACVQRDFSWFDQGWSKLAVLFWFVCLMSAVWSKLPLYSFGEAFVWIRFPLFLMASVFWVGRDRRISNLMVLSAAISVFTMCIILALELTLIGQTNGRLSWPYNDLIPGAFLSKAGLPVVVGLATACILWNGKARVFAAIFLLCIAVITMATGERVSFLLVFFSASVAVIMSKPSLSKIIIFWSISGLCLVMINAYFGQTWDRFVNNFLVEIPIGSHSGYFRAMLPSWYAFLDAPLLGIGPGNFRILCPDIMTAYPGYECLNHPHQFFIQLLGETGLMGFLTGVLFIGAMVWKLLIMGLKSNAHMFGRVAWIVPFAFFWPLSAHPDFFGQWHNLFMWTGISISMTTIYSRQ